MSDSPDPVLQAWQHVREGRAGACVDTVLLTRAALSGPESLPVDQRAHLLERRCRNCEERLIGLWESIEPGHAVRARLAQYPPHGAFGAALRVACPQSAPAAERVALTKPWVGRWLLERGAHMIGGLLYPDLGRPAYTSREDPGDDPPLGPPARPGRFGRAVTLGQQEDEGGERILLRVDRSKLAGRPAGALLVAVFQEQRPDPLATATLAPGAEQATLDIPAALALQDDIRVAVATVEERP